MGRSDRPPDIVLVVLDSVRAREFPGGDDPVAGLPEIERLRAGSDVYSRAVAPSSWTVPSHASLFTGRPVWDHGVHARGLLRLPPSASTLAASLGAQGYRTVAASANPLVGPATGLTSGFDLALVGTWHDTYLRGVPRAPPPPANGGTGWGSLSAHAVADPLATWLQRWPAPFEAGLRLLRGAGDDADERIDPWIEPALAAWYARVPPDVPTFAFVNYMDAHEPYLALHTEGSPGGVRQDRSSWIRGRWTPTEEELRRLRAQYRRSYVVLDRRLARLRTALDATGRWEGATIVLTSDHGQAFGERGFLYHGLRLFEPIVRVPLLVRPAGGEHGARHLDGWTSLSEVRGLLEAGGPDLAGAPGSPDGVVGTVSDGLSGPSRRRLAPSRLGELDRILVAGYDGERKITHDATDGSWEVVDLGGAGEARPERSSVAPGVAPPLERFVAETAERMRGAARRSPDGVAERLETWGYT